MMTIDQIREHVIRKNHGWHEAGDNLGTRSVYLNGKILHHVIRANERRGVVVVADIPARPDKHRKRILTRTLRGVVKVEWPA